MCLFYLNTYSYGGALLINYSWFYCLQVSRCLVPWSWRGSGPRSAIMVEDLISLNRQQALHLWNFNTDGNWKTLKMFILKGKWFYSNHCLKHDLTQQHNYYIFEVLFAELTYLGYVGKWLRISLFYPLH